MRVVFEKVEGEYFFEIILNEPDLDQFATLDEIIGDFIWENDGANLLNVYIRKEKEKELCLSLKEKKPDLEKDSLKMSKPKCMQENPKSRPSRSLIAKRVRGKKLLPKKK